MPIGNNFEHAAYSRSDPGDRVAYAEYEPGAPPGSAAWQDAMAQHGAALHHSGVRAVVFLHGSLLGTDPFGVQRLDEAGGLKRGYSRGIPGVDALLALMRDGSNGLDGPGGDEGTFSEATVETCAKALSTTAALTCRRMLWSSEQHHLGRAKAAIDLLGRFRALRDELKLAAGDRMLVLAHGQAGLVLALISNLLASEPGDKRARFLELVSAEMPNLDGVALDVVTLGTPVRYGWDPSGVGKLLHLINHRMMRADGKRWLAKMDLPQITMEMPIAWGGDYVQQLALAGSDAEPKSDADKALNKALWELLEPFDGFERWLECTRKCVRCPNDGLCLLIDYKDAGSSNPRDHYYGHAAYTRLSHQLFNFTQIVGALYR